MLSWFDCSISLLFYFLWVFTPSLVDSLSQESEWQQVTIGHQDSTEYSDRSHQCCSLNGLDSSTNQDLHSLIQAHPLQLVLHSLSCSTAFFSSQARSKYLSIFSLSFIITQWSAGTAKSTTPVVFYFVNKREVWSSGWDYLKIPKNFMRLIFLDGFRFVYIPF